MGCGIFGTGVAAGVGQAPTGQLEAGVGAKPVQVVGVLVTAGDGQDAGTQDISHAVRDEQRIARVRDQPREPSGDPQAALCGSQQHDAAVRRDASTVEGGGDFLAADGWKAERLDRIVGHGGCGSVRSYGKDGFDTQALNTISSLRDTRQRIADMPVNKTG